MEFIRRLLGHYRYPAIALVTLLTLGIVGAVVLTDRKVANFGAASTPTPRPVAKGGYTVPPQQPTEPPPPVNPGASTYPPYNPGASSPDNPGASSYPPYNPGNSGGVPAPNPVTGPPSLNPVSSGMPGQTLSCKLPVYAGGPGSGGFIVFPGQTFVADPRSAVTAPLPSPAPTPPAQQYGPGFPQGWFGLTYDSAYAKWVPVRYAWLSPDGAHYAYPLGGDTYAVNVATGTLQELDSGKNLNVLKVENDGVYAAANGQPGLWFLPFSGAAKQVATTHFWQAVSSGFAYGTPTSQVPPGASNTIDILDLKSGAITEFFTQAGGQSFVEGFDLQGHPIIRVQYQQGQAIFVVTSTSTTTVIAAANYGYGFSMPNGEPIADSHGIWFTLGSGVVLYANNQWYGMANIGGQLAGQCL